MSNFVDQHFWIIVVLVILPIPFLVVFGMVSIFYDAFYKTEIRAAFRRGWVRFPLLHLRTYKDWIRYVSLQRKARRGR